MEHCATIQAFDRNLRILAARDSRPRSIACSLNTDSSMATIFEDVKDGFMQTRRLGDREVSAIGLGAMPLTMDQRPSEDDAIATVHAALDVGITLIDTADAYTWAERGPGANEELIAKALASYGAHAGDVVVATKGGHTRNGADWGLDGSPAYLRRACEDSLRRLGVEAIDLYQHHRPDPDVSYAETMGGLLELYDAGLVRRVGISNANADQIRIAQAILGDALVSVQNEFSPRFRSSEPEITLCAELGLAFLPWSPLGGIGRADQVGSVFPAFAEVGLAHDASPQQVCLAWELALSPVVIPIPGASRPASIRSSVAAADLRLTPAELERLSRR
jgi:aryl-alcohol dehydrogenase-like predicted oxidoreductase